MMKVGEPGGGLSQPGTVCGERRGWGERCMKSHDSDAHFNPNNDKRRPHFLEPVEYIKDIHYLVVVQSEPLPIEGNCGGTPHLKGIQGCMSDAPVLKRVIRGLPVLTSHQHIMKVAEGTFEGDSHQVITLSCCAALGFFRPLHGN